MKINNHEDYIENEYKTIIKNLKKIFEYYVIDNNKKLINNKNKIIIENK